MAIVPQCPADRLGGSQRVVADGMLVFDRPLQVDGTDDQRRVRLALGIAILPGLRHQPSKNIKMMPIRHRHANQSLRLVRAGIWVNAGL